MAQINLPYLALILAAAARGTTHLTGIGGAGVLPLVTALTALGARLEEGAVAGRWTVCGTGVGGWREPGCVLELGPAPGAVPLLAGMLATLPLLCVLSADSEEGRTSLRPLRAALERVGAGFMLGGGDRLPGCLIGTGWPLPAHHGDVSGAAALALLLAGLNSPGRTGVDAHPDLDRALDLLRRFGAEIQTVNGVAWITGYPDLVGTEVTFMPGCDA
ncbi:hypothetical protein CHU95_06620 [Niveispirillum lacus]|uniref:Enolpyruvate transferase domain-containing protein n=1 Tax=Niveispirillum lacus TaxID=1981099 RepID=A0A255Z372_9PROT|nr:hypothetical protein [Niveispirillum lacus]OYQ35928.1 hypothetical protein CHU95_06620 [Niveispirillum lacus]